MRQACRRKRNGPDSSKSPARFAVYAVFSAGLLPLAEVRLLLKTLADCEEVLGLECGASDQAAVDVLLGEDLGSV